MKPTEDFWAAMGTTTLLLAIILGGWAMMAELSDAAKTNTACQAARHDR